MLVRQILGMKGGGDVVTIGADASVTDAVRLLSEKRIGALLVADDGGVPLGILSERDIVRELGRRDETCLRDSVGDMMTKNLVSCLPDDTAPTVGFDLYGLSFPQLVSRLENQGDLIAGSGLAVDGWGPGPTATPMRRLYRLVTTRSPRRAVLCLR